MFQSLQNNNNWQGNFLPFVIFTPRLWKKLETELSIIYTIHYFVSEIENRHIYT